jgi:hypothetical protein
LSLFPVRMSWEVHIARSVHVQCLCKKKKRPIWRKCLRTIISHGTWIGESIVFHGNILPPTSGLKKLAEGACLLVSFKVATVRTSHPEWRKMKLWKKCRKISKVYSVSQELKMCIKTFMKTSGMCQINGEYIQHVL